MRMGPHDFGGPLIPRKEKEKRGKSSRRSVRFILEVPAVFWSGGASSGATRTRTRDISRTGLYFYGQFEKPLGTTFNFEVQLPAPIGGAGGILKGQGMLVRRDILGERRVGFAAEIFQYEFTPAEEPGSKGPRASQRR